MNMNGQRSAIRVGQPNPNIPDPPEEPKPKPSALDGQNAGRVAVQQQNEAIEKQLLIVSGGLRDLNTRKNLMASELRGLAHATERLASLVEQRTVMVEMFESIFGEKP